MTNICNLMRNTFMIKHIVPVLLGGFCLLFLACNGDQESIVQEKVAERVSAFKRKKNLECQETLLQTAEQIVDSLLLTDAQSALNDSLTRLRPGRPFLPPAIPPIDSLKVAPIFEGGRPASQTGG
ncbi:MAG: hypothetical protein Q7U74_00380 [Saprospiraceae bacterium]|nr:hypothetical protein [Saprospiraceae bacterium]